MTDYAQARDIIQGRFYSDWKTLTTAIVGYVPDVRWPGNEKAFTPDADKYWARLSYQTVSEGQTSFRDGVNGKRYTNNGLVFVQHYAPMSITDSKKKLMALALITQNAFRKSTGLVWYRNARMRNDIVADGTFWGLDVVSEYQYDDLTA